MYGETANITVLLNFNLSSFWNLSIFTRCLRGCGDKVNPGENLTVLSMCRSCETHSWAVYGCGSLCDTEVKVTDRPQNESVFSFHVNNSFINQQVVYIGKGVYSL